MGETHRERCDKAFEFQGAMAVALLSIRRLAAAGELYEGSPVMSHETRCALIVSDCDEMLAKLPAGVREFAAKCAG